MKKGFWSIVASHGTSEVARRLGVTARYVRQMRSLDRDVTPEVMDGLSAQFSDEWDANAHIVERAERRRTPSAPAPSASTAEA